MPARQRGPARQHRHAHRVHNCRNQRRSADAAAVGAAGDDGIDAVLYRLHRMADSANVTHHIDVPVMRRANCILGRAEAGDQHRHAVVEDHVDHILHHVGIAGDGIALGPDRGEQDIDAEEPAPMTPSPPASDTMAASAARATQPIPA